MRLIKERGSGTLLGFGLISMILGIMTVGFTVSIDSLAITRLQAQTDNVAIAAEDVLRGLSVGFPCERAGEIVQGFGGVLEDCHKVELDIYISVSTEVMGIVHRANSRASSE